MRKTTFLALLFSLSAVGLFVGRTSADSEAPLDYTFVDNGRQVSPMDLTAADGTGLALKLFHARTVVEGPLAFTELRLTFENPENRVREGHFRITLPEGAAISRFAMRIDDVWQEAEVVELQAARRAYEDFLHRRQDPALLEKAAGNEFSARIFPIPAKGEKELILSYSQELPRTDTPYTLTLQGLPKVKDFEIEVRRNGSKEKVLFQNKNYQPRGDFQLTARGAHGATVDTLLSNNLLVTRVTPSLKSTADVPADLLVLLDTSASRALGLSAQQVKLQELIRALPPMQKLTVAAFDQDLEVLYRGSSEHLDLTKLTARGAHGATDLRKALHWAAAQKEHSRLLLVTDGISTAGATQVGETLKGSGLQRVDVMLVGGIRDREAMDLLVGSGLPTQGVVVEGELPIEEISSKLQGSVTSGLDVSFSGAEWVWPTALNNVQPGDQRLIYAKLDPSHGGLQLKVGSQTIDLKPTLLETSPLLLRSSVIARIELLEGLLDQAEDPEERESLSEQIVALSTEHRVLSSKTALLVLETDADYQRFNIDRTALSDVLVVGATGLEVKNRSEVHLPPVAWQAPKDEPYTPGASVDAAVLVEESTAPTPSAALNYSIASEASGSAPPPSPVDNYRISTETVAAEGGNGGQPQPRENRADLPRSRTQASPRRAPAPQPEPAPAPAEDDAADYTNEMQPAEAKVQAPDNPTNGKYAEIEALRKNGKNAEALKLAQGWQKEEPGNVLALVALADCLEAAGRQAEAARVIGSIIDLFPSRADLRRYAGSRLQALGRPGLELAVDTFTKAVEQRPDHVSSHRFLAFALARSERYEEGMEALEAGLSRNYPDGRFRSYERILKEDLGLIAAAWLKKDPTKKNEIYRRLKKYDSQLAKKPSLRFILTWETDANDVDFHITDKKGGHAYYSSPVLESGGELYGDVTTGYGPECFAIEGTPKAYPYSLQIHYYSRGPMGYGMGQLEVLRHDGSGGLEFEERPYLVMVDGAYVDLGTVEKRP